MHLLIMVPKRRDADYRPPRPYRRHNLLSFVIACCMGFTVWWLIDRLVWWFH